VADDGGYVLLVLIHDQRNAIVGEALAPGTLARVKDGAFEVTGGVLSGGVWTRAHNVSSMPQTARKQQRRSEHEKFRFQVVTRVTILLFAIKGL
jgi:hypothetical protein